MTDCPTYVVWLHVYEEYDRVFSWYAKCYDNAGSGLSILSIVRKKHPCSYSRLASQFDSFLNDVLLRLSADETMVVYTNSHKFIEFVDSEKNKFSMCLKNKLQLVGVPMYHSDYAPNVKLTGYDYVFWYKASLQSETGQAVLAAFYSKDDEMLEYSRRITICNNVFDAEHKALRLALELLEDAQKKGAISEDSLIACVGDNRTLITTITGDSVKDGTLLSKSKRLIEQLHVNLVWAPVKANKAVKLVRDVVS